MDLPTGTKAVLETAEGVSNYGITIMICALFLVITGMMWFFVFKWFRHLIEGIVTRQEETMQTLLNETKQQNSVLADINEGLRPISQMQISSICSNFFDLDCEKLCRLVKTVRAENNIDDREATRKKIETRVGAIFKNRSIEYSNFVLRGRRLSDYMKMGWIKKFVEIIENEIYSPTGENNARAYANIKTGIDEIKAEFTLELNS